MSESAGVLVDDLLILCARLDGSIMLFHSL